LQWDRKKTAPRVIVPEDNAGLAISRPPIISAGQLR